MTQNINELLNARPYRLECELEVVTHRTLVYDANPDDSTITDDTSKYVAEQSSSILQEVMSKIPRVIQSIRRDVFLTKDEQRIDLEFYCDEKAPIGELIEHFPEFHLIWRDVQTGILADPKTGREVCGRFGEVWTKGFIPSYFHEDAAGAPPRHGDWYRDVSGANIVFNKIGHELIFEDTVITVGQSDTECNYGAPVHPFCTDYGGRHRCRDFVGTQ
jgi:hypothetical protein